MSEFDIIIVGAGSAGSIAANRLSQDQNLKILSAQNLESQISAKCPQNPPKVASQADNENRQKCFHIIESDVVWLDLHGEMVIHPKSVL